MVAESSQERSANQSKIKDQAFRGGYLEPEGDASQKGIHSDMDALLQGGIQADAGPIALPT